MTNIRCKSCLRINRYDSMVTKEGKKLCPDCLSGDFEHIDSYLHSPQIMVVDIGEFIENIEVTISKDCQFVVGSQFIDCKKGDKIGWKDGILSIIN